MKMTKAGILALCVCAVPHVASAQTMQFTDKGFISVGGGAQTGSHTLETSSTFTLYDENASVATSQKISGGGFFEIGGAYRVWGNNLLAGVTYTHTSSKSDVALTASLPHPNFFDQPRTVTSTQSGAKHAENGIHLSAFYMIPVANKLDIAIFGGPSFFRVNQDTVTTVSVTETADLTKPTVTAPLTKVSKSATGGHIGADVQYMVTKRFGVGGTMRYTGASVAIPDATKKLGVGGFQISGGARVRF